MKTFIEYWRSQALKVNLGDYITEILAERLGHSVTTFSSARVSNTFEDSDRCLLAVGTLLDSYWFSYINIQKDIWGCGYGGDSRFRTSHFSEKAVFHAVRGPLTRQALNLPADCPIGDPALLLPHLFDIRKNTGNRTIYVPHFESRDALGRNTLEIVGADALVDICCLRDQFWQRIQEIVDAEFVVTSSLHGAIIAQAFGTPWALCCPPGVKQNMPFKWDDWFSYLGVSGEICCNIADGAAWWSAIGHKGRVRDLEPLIKAFPGQPINL